MRGLKLGILHLALLSFSSAIGAIAVVTRTYCNPLNLDHGWGGKGRRHSADTVVVLFKDYYHIFATNDVPRYRVPDDLSPWFRVPFSWASRPLISDNDEGTYCAPAVAADESHIYFIRSSRRKEDRILPVIHSADPALGTWEECGGLRVTGDPTLFFDSGRAWFYHGLSYPRKVFESDTQTCTETRGSDRRVARQI